MSEWKRGRPRRATPWSDRAEVCCKERHELVDDLPA